jgi:hypothetical protein
MRVRRLRVDVSLTKGVTAIPAAAAPGMRSSGFMVFMADVIGEGVKPLTTS